MKLQWLLPSFLLVFEFVALPANAVPFTGKVAGPDGKPVAGVTVRATAQPQGGKLTSKGTATVTDASGAFQLDVDELDIKYMPEFVDRSVAKRINAALIKYATTIAWNFSKTLTGIVNLPQRLEMVRTLELGAPEGRVEVTEDGIVIGLSVGVSFHHVGEVVVLDPPSPADDGSRQAEP